MNLALSLYLARSFLHHHFTVLFFDSSLWNDWEEHFAACAHGKKNRKSGSMEFMSVIVLFLAGSPQFPAWLLLVSDDSQIVEWHPVEIVKVHISPVIRKRFLVSLFSTVDSKKKDSNVPDVLIKSRAGRAKTSVVKVSLKMAHYCWTKVTDTPAIWWGMLVFLKKGWRLACSHEAGWWRNECLACVATILDHYPGEKKPLCT